MQKLHETAKGPVGDIAKSAALKEKAIRAVMQNIYGFIVSTTLKMRSDAAEQYRKDLRLNEKIYIY